MGDRLAQTMTKIFGSPGVGRPGESEISRRFARSTSLAFSIGIWVAAMALFFVTETQALEVNRGENIADAAEQLIGELRETHYQHQTNAIQSAGIYDMDLVITFAVDDQDSPVGFQFNSQAHFHQEPIAIGRLVH